VGPRPQEAVQRALEQLGEGASIEEIAAFIATAFGLKVQEGIIRVVRASLRERPALEQSRLKALEAIEKARAEEAASEQPRPKKARRRAAAKPADAERTLPGEA
jgi:DNA polymerase elongation subunit (family B)